MKNRIIQFAACCALICAALVSGTTKQAAAGGDVTVFSAKDTTFEAVVQGLNDAIVNRGFTIDYHGFIGDMLKRTAEDVGAKKELYKDAEFFTFCSAVVSRRVMEADIGNIAYCPYVLFVYEEQDMPGTVTVGFRHLPEGGGRDEVNALLEEIAKEASEGF
ncbi:MAG: DUF302 domain-containing protein [Rhodobiaceae bacterium]|nr:DUF302 domain-containing protein [Rhodobiaceae bacterium]MCC0012999.1 DUF302 domain-containing protein [Rhodobiaceae bacterium]MCC0052045.1 DUF302 domain-containing protein [Rhodobiaceae bacterium]MCC0061612.1 DUF302 domain-containing protein [Rhodobiaceae bacterium]